MYFWKDPDAGQKAMKQLAIAVQTLEESIDAAFARAAKRLGESGRSPGAPTPPRA